MMTTMWGIDVFVEGEYDFVEKYRKAFPSCDFAINSKPNSIYISGDYDPKEILYKTGILGEHIYWIIGKEKINIYRIQKLQEVQKLFFDKKEWKTVRLINKIIKEVEIYQKVTEVHYYPTKLQIEHSTICNAKCIMCTHYFTNNYKRGFIEDEVIENLIPIFPFVEKILLHGVGEALLHPNIQIYLKLYVKYDIEVSCVTNMSFMSKELAQLLGATFKTITISCDGASKETFENIRRGISFEKFCNNVRLLHSQRPDLELRFNVVCMKQNIEEMPEIITLASNLGVKAVGISDLIAQKILDNHDDEIKNYPTVALVYLKRAIERAQELGIRLLQIPDYVFDLRSDKTFDEELEAMRDIPFYHSLEFQKNLYERYIKLDMVKPTQIADLQNYAIESQYSCKGICDYFVGSPFIGVTGEVTTCCIDGIHIMGNLKECSFLDIWNSKVYQRMRALFYQGTIPKYCVGCMFLKNHTKIERLTIREQNEKFLEHNFSELIDKSDAEKL